MTGDDYKIVSDKSANGIRHITAVPSKLVCSVRIDFDIIDNKIYNLAYTRGCEGNLKAIGILLDGMETDKVIAKLHGVNCHGRGTACSDQLARILETVTAE
ncbi:MAG: TIGR03905 family TSCPD domain-containing protein [Bacteroidales bacterium]|jgi:uncharacterized protein (TIGR03905 family)|nr:TIGR03905 family TSCPD domain-containing protein [Bacteroidales bacterium]